MPASSCARSKEVKAAAIDARARRWRSSCAPAPASTPSTSRPPRARGIYVANCPGKNAIAVAELTMGLLLALDRRIPDAGRAICAPAAWNKKEYGKADGLFGRTLGVVGAGAIGQRGHRARARAFGMHVVAWSRSLDDARGGRARRRARAHGARAVRARRRGHAARGAHAGDARARRRGGARGACGRARMLVNTARAEVVDTGRSCAPSREKELRVALDVFDDEPEGRDRRPSPTRSGSSPASTARTTSAPRPSRRRRAIADETVRIVRAFVERGEVPNCVNLAHKRSPARVPAGRAPLRQGRRARRGARRDPPPRHQRRGDGEHHLRGRAAASAESGSARGRRRELLEEMRAHAPPSCTSTSWSCRR